MDKNVTILIYEKEKHLNSILYQQIHYTSNYEPYQADDQTKLLELLNKKKFDVCVLNIENLDCMSKPVFEKLLKHNQFMDIVGYFDNSVNSSTIDSFRISLLPKPFKIKNLLQKFENIKLLKNQINKKILMKNIEFSPKTKTLYNIDTNVTLHLTEKENHLLNYLYNNKNLELKKNDLLINIWGVTERINTHTLETHIYRLKQKLLKLEPNLSFSLTNQNGLYSMKYL